MTTLKDRILQLQQISEELEPNEAQRTSYLNEVGDYANTFINNLQTEKAFTPSDTSPNAMALDPNKMDLSSIIQLYDREVAQKGIKPASGGHVGYIPGGGIYTSSISDFLVDITNDYVGMYFSCPGGVAIEHVLLDWMKSIFDFPKSAIGNLTSGGSIANLVALTAARDRHGVKNEKIT